MSPHDPKRPDVPVLNSPPQDDAPLRLAPDQDDEDRPTFARRRKVNGSMGQEAAETVIDAGAPMPMPLGKSNAEALRWALDSLHHPAMAAADWLARDIDPTQSTATALLTNPAITMAQVRQAKTVFKTMRIVGEKSADRRVGARMYAAAIAAGLVRHGKMVSTQSEAALTRGFQGLLDDRKMPRPLRDLGGLALCIIHERHQDGGHKKSA